MQLLSENSSRRTCLLGSLCVLGAVTVGVKYIKLRQRSRKGIAAVVTTKHSVPHVGNAIFIEDKLKDKHHRSSSQLKELPDFSSATENGLSVEVGSKVTLLEIEDVHDDSLWNGSDSAFCGRTGFVKRVDPDGDVEVSFIDGSHVVCDVKFLTVDESPSQSQLLRSPLSDGLFGSSINSNSTNVGMGAMASSFSELGPR